MEESEVLWETVFYFLGRLYTAQEFNVPSGTVFKKGVNFLEAGILAQNIWNNGKNIWDMAKKTDLNLRSYLRGIFDEYALYVSASGIWSVNILLNSDSGNPDDLEEGLDVLEEKLNKLEDALQLMEVHFEKRGELLTYHGPNAIDILSILFDNANIYSDSRETNPEDILTEVRGITTKEIPNVRVTLSEGAHFPTKKRASDVGWDLTIIKIHKVYESGTILYDTGVTVQPPDGWYLEIVPRSGFSGSGWIMPNSMGIIDKSYTGTIKVPVIQISPRAQGKILAWNERNVFSLELPFCGFQIIPRMHIHVLLQLTNRDEILNTERSEKGFGSRNMDASLGSLQK